MNNVLKIKKITDFWFPKQYTHKEVLESVKNIYQILHKIECIIKNTTP